ncbi:hypothetical protein [Xenorhabdus hominickii]|uniref:Uncharacterized protein n=1 Tax=Xenorhabdus hominickii TaxID=351679 RepID=A0A1V0M3U8_XENHO|nr:hypothetical protein [Xenorhabdus hominickii]ARD69573.1 hypothetical protein [Xenorhabdus hominickii]PHM52404.1 hypothetical protein Xhom_04482 [Xenorhabdus hominickii]
MKPAKIKLLEPAFTNYTGIMCGIMFKNGESKTLVPFIEQQRICSIMKAETVEGKNVSGAATLAESRDMTSVDALKVEQKAEQIKPSQRESEVDELIVRYTRGELEALADKGGIAALREVGERLDIHEKSIELMIEKILIVAGE